MNCSLIMRDRKDLVKDNLDGREALTGVVDGSRERSAPYQGGGAPECVDDPR
jgi:hypothetical protein